MNVITKENEVSSNKGLVIKYRGGVGLAKSVSVETIFC